MQFGNREFSPRLWPTIATLILLPILLRLGFWQLDRADEKQQIEQRYAQQHALPAVQLSQLDTTSEIEYRRVTVRGRFDAYHQVLLDNQIHEKQAGYHVLTPLRIEGENRYVLINRGWVDGQRRRDKLPALPTPEQTIQLSGRLKLPSKIGLELSDQSYTRSGWPLVVQWVDIQELEEQIGYELYPYIVRLDEEQSYGFVRNWKIISSSPEQSTSYAVQWFTLALVLVLIFILVNSRKIDDAKHERK